MNVDCRVKCGTLKVLWCRVITAGVLWFRAK